MIELDLMMQLIWNETNFRIFVPFCRKNIKVHYGNVSIFLRIPFNIWSNWHYLLMEKIRRKNDKAVKILVKAQIVLWKTIEFNRLRVRVRVWVRCLLFYSELAPTDPWCNMLRTLLGRKNMTRQCQTNTL